TGVAAYSFSSAGSAGLFDAGATSGATTGIVVLDNSASGTAGIFNNVAGGNILVGQNNSANKFRVDGTGKGFFDGGTQTGGADFAESVAAAPMRNPYEPGDLLVVDTTAKRQLRLATEAYSPLVAGIYSTKPGVLATTHKGTELTPSTEIPLAILG